MDPMSFLLEVRHSLREKHGSYEVFLQTMQDFKSQKINTDRLIKTLMKLFQGQKALTMGFNEFLPKQYKIIPEEDVEAFNFVKRVKTTFKNDHGVFLEFLQIIDTYRRENKSITEVYKEIAVLFRGHDDLLTEFKSFLPYKSVKRSVSPPLDIIIIPTIKKRRVEEKSVENKVCDKGITFFDKVNATLRDSDICQGLMTCVELYNNKIISRPELRELVDDLIGEYPDLVKGFDKFMGKSEKITKSEDVCSSKSMEDNLEELDLSTCKKITPNYRLLPMNCRSPAIRHESLDDGIVCVAPPPKGDGFQVRCKNRFEEKLFKCEDDMFEMQMKINLINATLESAKELLRQIREDDRLGEHPVLRVEEHFTYRKMGCIKELFDDRGPKFLDSLKENVYNLLPTVFERLILEERKLCQIYVDSKKRWKQIFKDNHRRALGYPL